MLLYLHGFASGPGSAKAVDLARRFAAEGRRMEIADLTPGPLGFERSTPSSMLAIVHALLAGAPGPHALVGSSLGGWLSAVAASRDPRIERLVLLARAFNLVERWRGRLSPAELDGWRRGGLEVDHHATGTRRRRGPGRHGPARGHRTVRRADPLGPPRRPRRRPRPRGLLRPDLRGGARVPR